MRCLAFSLLTLSLFVSALPHLQAADEKKDAPSKIGFRQLVAFKPAAVQQGDKRQIQLHTSYTLDGTHSVFFDQPGIKMTFTEPKPKAAPRRGRGSVGTPFSFDIEVPQDQPTRVYECRVATDQAVSSVSHLLVTPYPVIEEVEKKDNNTYDTAQEVTVPSTVCGIVEKSEDLDCYKFKGKKGQEVTIQVYAQRVTEAIHTMQTSGVYLMDSILTLYGPQKQIVAQNDNYIKSDSLITFKLPADGEYVFEIRDARYVGTGKYAYCIEVSDTPFVNYTMPMAVQKGKTADVNLHGFALKGHEKATFSAADTKETGWAQRTFTTPAGKTNAVWTLISDNPQVAAPNTNTSMEKAFPLTLPVGVSGQLTEAEQTHYYSFKAKKDQYYSFDLMANRIDLPLDCVMEVLDGKAKPQRIYVNGGANTEADDGLSTKDANFYFKAPADGEYYVTVRDLHDRGGERFAYHLSAELSGPEFEVHGEYYYAQIAPGTNMMWFARVKRLNEFDGPIELNIEGLPEGVSLEPVTLPPGVNDCGLILKASKDAPINASLVKISGKAKVPGPDGKEQEIVRYGRITCEIQSGGGGQARWPINTSIVGVTKPLDLLEVKATPSEITLKPGESAEIKVTIKRSEAYKDPVVLATAFEYFNSKFGQQLPPGVTLSKKSKTRLAGKTLEGTLIIEASDKAKPIKRFPFAAMARVGITFSITTNYASNVIYLTITDPDGKDKLAKK
ncbi:putative subtilase-type serine protease precursor [Gimesia panareensis]|uniref:Putative subtilase-type serine protease n=1 Tax=Gimesia panareensis TaxID=2527978 RepID=A0A517QFY0_9PLAN|nr:PPC domain-containing protein [Gimesia panareensis]QDT30543.1 putative subtilase-type serine protease precursor [Gimesia panareensis]